MGTDLSPLAAIEASLHSDVFAMQQIANNTANVSTPGFKKIFSALHLQQGLSDASSKPDQVATQFDWSPGVLKQTDRALDVAIRGKGLFEVQTQDGVAYTRRGDFRLDQQGRLVCASGFPVMGTTGEIVLTTSTPRIDGRGRIYAGQQLVSQLKQISIDDLRQLTPIGEGLFKLSDGAGAKTIESDMIQQGALEASNVDSAKEMISLIETFRHFESGHRVVQIYDDVKDKTIRNLGQF